MKKDIFISYRNDGCSNQFANLLFWGRGCETDLNKAYEFYTRAHRHGIHYAEIMLKQIEKMTGQ